jgi:hypothetical protein
MENLNVHGDLHCWSLVHMERKERYDFQKYNFNSAILEEKIQENFPIASS